MAKFITKKEKRRRLILFLVCLPLFLGGGLGIYFLNDKIKFLREAPENPENLPKLTQQLKEAEEKIKINEEAFYNFSKPIGWRTIYRDTTERYPVTGIQTKSIRAFLDDWVKILERDYNNIKYISWDKPEEGGRIHLIVEDLFRQLETYYNDTIRRVEVAKSDVDRFKAEEEKIVNDTKEEVKRRLEEIWGNDLKKMGGRIKEILDLERQLRELQKRHADELSQLKDTLFNKTQELNELRKKNAEEVVRLEKARDELQVRLDWLILKIKEEREKKEPDGKVIFSDLERNIARINLKYGDRIFVGTRFWIFSIDIDGSKTDRGQVEVIEINDQYSVIKPIEIYHKDYKLNEGDCVFDEFYDKTKPKTFAVAGRLTWRLGLEELVKRLEANGDIYHKIVTDTKIQRTNYIILGKDYENDPNWALAQKFAVKPILERHLYHSLGIPR